MTEASEDAMHGFRSFIFRIFGEGDFWLQKIAAIMVNTT